MKKFTLLFLTATCATLVPPAARAAPRAPQAAAAAPGASSNLGNIRLTNVRLDEVARLLSQVGNANVVVTNKVADEVVSLYLNNASVEDMVRNATRAAGVWFRFDPQSKTYIIMSGEEYQKDLSIVRDEKTRIFTLRHHNVVSTANAIKSLFGQRVTLSIPIEETPPISLGGGGDRTRSGNSSSGSSSGTRTGSGGSGNVNLGGNSQMGNQFGGTMGSGGSTGMAASLQQGRGSNTQGGQSSYDPSSDLKTMSLDRMTNQMQYDAHGQATLSASDIQAMAARQGPPILVTYNKLNNLLMVRTGDDQALKEIAGLVADMDRPPKQVLLEMKILEVSLDDGFTSVFDIGTGSKGVTTAPSRYSDGTFTRPSAPELSRNALGSGLFGVESSANLVWQVMSANLSVRLQLLANENKLKVLSSPMLVAANNQLARLFIGDETVLTTGWTASQTTTNATTTTTQQPTPETEKRDVGQTLAILPRINGDRSISLTIDQDSSTVKKDGASIPLIDAQGQITNNPIDIVATANLQVTAHAKDGMTVAIGGMIRETVIRNEEKVPVIGDVPVIGFFFKRDVRAKTRSQIVLLVTPRIIETAEEGQDLATNKMEGFNATTAVIPDNMTVPKLSNDWPVAPPTGIDRTTIPEADTSYAGLARAASAAVQMRDPSRAPEGLVALPPGPRTDLVLDNGMPAELRGSWQRNGLFVTALRVSNLAPRNQTLQAAALPGRWAAVVIERPELGPEGSVNSATWLYAISRQPFEQALALP